MKMPTLVAAAAIAMTTAAATAGGPRIWSGYDFEYDHPFSMAPADYITPNVGIQRSNIRGIFNEASETLYVDGVSPADTEWAFGTTADWDTLTYADWKTAIGANPPLSIGQNMVVHLISDDIYLDIRFTGWGSIGSGAFSYVRAVPTPGTAAIFGAAGLAMTRRRR